jgi:hypothetical protein
MMEDIFPILILLMIVGLANLFFPKQVIKMCEEFGRLTPFIPDGPFARNVAITRVAGAILIAICVAIAIIAVFS